MQNPNEIDLLQAEYDKTQLMVTEIEKETINLIIAINSALGEFSEEKIQQLNEFEVKLKYLQLRLITLEELTRANLFTLSDSNALDYRVKVLSYYGLFFYASKLVNCVLKDQTLDESWFAINQTIINGHENLHKKIHVDKKNELFIGNMLVLMCQEIANNKLFLSDEQELKRLLKNYTFFTNFVNQIQNKYLKIQCFVYLFSFENESCIKRILDSAFQLKRRSKDFYLTKIIDLLQGQKTSDDCWYHYLAHCTYLFNELVTINNKIFKTESEMVPEKTEKKTTSAKTRAPSKTNCILNIKNNFVVYQELVRLLEEHKLKEIISEIEKTIARPGSMDLVYFKILQSKELILILLNTMQLCLYLSNRIVNSCLKKTDKIEPDIYYIFLKFHKIILELLIKVNECQQTLNGKVLDSKEKLLEVANNIETAIKDIENEKSKQEILCNNFLSLLEPHSKKGKKILKRRSNRQAYLKLNKQQSCSINNDDLYQSITEEAEGHILVGKFLKAIQLYQVLLNDKTISSSQIIASHIALGDIYQQTADSVKSLEHYHLAEELTKLELIKEQGPAKEELEIRLAMIQDLMKDLDETSDASSTSSGEAVGINDGSCTEQKSLSNQRHRIVPQVIPLPPLFDHIYQLCLSLNLRLYLVGGVIRDFLLKENGYFDIDAVILDPTFKQNKQELLHALLKALKPYYPSCEIRSRSHPILYIQLDNIIIEISSINVLPKEFKNKELSQIEILNLLNEDAMHRDTTDNALYYDPNEKVIIDFFDGIEDINSNKLVPIQPPETAFGKDPTLIFRLLRSIIRRSIIRPDQALTYSSSIVTAMQDNGERINSMNKDRCFKEIQKTLFRGCALPTWNFLLQHNLQHYFFPLPKDEYLNFKHSIMVAKALANLDNRVKLGKRFHYSFTFAVLLWGVFWQELELQKKQNESLNEPQINTTLRKLFNSQELIFRLPEALAVEVQQIWIAYLHQSNIVKFPNPRLSYFHFTLGNILGDIIKRSLLTAPQQKISLAKNRNQFFGRTRLELLLRETVRSNEMTYSYFNKTTTLSLANDKHVLSTNDKFLLLKQLRRNLKLVLGKFGINYEIINSNKICISSNYFDKKRATDHLMNFIFDSKSSLINHINI